MSDSSGPSGVLSLSVLAASALCGRCFASIMVRRYMAAMNDLLTQLELLSITLCAMSAVFWSWASYKLLFKHDPDMGVVSFLVAFTSNYRTADLCYVQSRRAVTAPNVLAQQRCLHPICLALVAANYFGVLLYHFSELPASFALYLLVGTIVWLTAALRVRALLHFATLRDASGDEQLERGELIPSTPPPSPPPSPPLAASQQ